MALGDDDNIAAEESEGRETDGEGDSNEEANDRLEEIQEMDESSLELPQQIRQRREPVWMCDYEIGEHLFEEEEVDEGFSFHISNDDPVNFEETVKEKKWQEAMKLEIQAIDRNQTWELVTLPHQAKKIGVKWVFKTNLNEEGKVDKCKARLVAKGYLQKAEVDYNEVYAPVARWIQSESGGSSSSTWMAHLST